jgi:Fe2+ transport system protein B
MAWTVLINEGLAPLTSLLGLPAAVGTTLIFGIMRKELSLVMLNEALGTTQFHTVLTQTQLLTFTVFVLFYIPCASTIAALSREIGWRGAAAQCSFPGPGPGGPGASHPLKGENYSAPLQTETNS